MFLILLESSNFPSAKAFKIMKSLENARVQYYNFSTDSTYDRHRQSNDSTAYRINNFKKCTLRHSLLNMPDPNIPQAQDAFHRHYIIQFVK